MAIISQNILKIYLLGAPHVEWGEQSIAISRRNVRGLLYRLAAETDPIPRASLCLLFWPDIPETVSRRNLTHTLTHLRLALPEGRQLLNIADTIGLDAQAVWCDVIAFKRLIIAGPQETASLRQAVNLYPGPFLSGFSLPNCAEFEHWASVERSGLERSYLEALDKLIDYEITSGDYPGAIGDILRYLSVDDLAEDQHRRLIALYAMTDQRPAALKQYELCVAVLERELGVNPLPETHATYQQVLAGKIPWLTPPVHPKTTAPLDAQFVELPLVGRESAWSDLEAALSRACQGVGNIVCITGEAGIGKSRLINDFLAGCRPEANILFASGYPHENMIPFRPVVDAIRSDEKLLSSKIDLAPVRLTEVGRLFPELSSRFHDLPPLMPSDLEEARLRLFDALSHLVLALAAAPRVTILCIDDLQWVDHTTLEWLNYFCHKLSSIYSRLLIIVSFRDDEMNPTSELSWFLDQSGKTTLINLTGLDEQAIGKLVRKAFAGQSIDENLVPNLKHATGGNPFFLKEVLHALLENGGTFDLERLPISQGMKDAVERRLRGLDAKIRLTLEASAVLGPTLVVDSVCLTAGRSEMETLDSLERLCSDHILFEDPGGYHFTHDLLRQAVEAGLSPVRRQLLHRRAGRTLEKLDPAATSVLAYHFESGGEYQAALQYHQLAAQSAHALFAWQEAEYHLDRMQALIGQIDPHSKDRELIRKRGTILAEKAKLHYFQNQIAERDADLRLLADLANAANDDQLQLLALTGRVNTLNHSGQNAEAAAAAESGLLLARRLEDRSAQLFFLAQLGLAHYFLGQPAAALAALEPARALSEQEHNLDMLGDVSEYLGHVHFHLGNYVRSLAYYQEALECARQLNDQSTLVWCILNIGFLDLKLGNWETSQEHLQAGLSLARQGDMPAVGFALTLLGQWELYRGNYSIAIDILLEALDFHQKAHTWPNLAVTEELIGMVYYQLGDLEQSLDWLGRAAERVRSMDYRRLLATVLIDQGLVEIDRGRLDIARGFLIESIDLSRDCECRENLAKGLCALAGLEGRAGNTDLALSHAQGALKIAGESALPACQVWGETEAGVAFLALGEPSQALECTGRAIALLPQAHEAWIGSERVHFTHARCLRAAGQADLAAEHERLSSAILQAKAGKIKDPKLNKLYLSSARNRLDKA